MKRILAVLLTMLLFIGCLGGSAFAVNEDVEGTVGIYSSMYQFVLDMLDEAIKKEFPNLTPAYDGSFFFYGGTSSLITKLYGEMDTGTLSCDMMLVAEPAFSLELKEDGYLEPIEIEGADDLLRFPYDEEGYWYPVRVCNMVLACNPEMADAWAAKGVNIPKSFKDFATDPSLKGYISMGNPLTSGTTFAAVASLTEDDHYGEDYLKGLADNKVRSGRRGHARHESSDHLSRGRRHPDPLHGHDRRRGPQRQRQRRRLRGPGKLVFERGRPEAHHGGLHALRVQGHEGNPLGLR